MHRLPSPMPALSIAEGWRGSSLSILFTLSNISTHITYASPSASEGERGGGQYPPDRLTPSTLVRVEMARSDSRYSGVDTSTVRAV